MLTWGTVLSTSQIRDLVVLFRACEYGETVGPPNPEEAMPQALDLLEHGDMHTVEHALHTAAEGASGEALALINKAIFVAES